MVLRLAHSGSGLTVRGILKDQLWHSRHLLKIGRLARHLACTSIHLLLELLDQAAIIVCQTTLAANLQKNLLLIIKLLNLEGAGFNLDRLLLEMHLALIGLFLARLIL